MRLSNRIQKTIKQSILKSFGDVNVYLFGSRVHDDKKGGDIDLAVDTNIPKEEFKKCKIKFVSLMFKSGYNLKIDIVQYKNCDILLTDEIERNKIELMNKNVELIRKSPSRFNN